MAKEQQRGRVRGAVQPDGDSIELDPLLAHPQAYGLAKDSAESRTLPAITGTAGARNGAQITTTCGVHD